MKNCIILLILFLAIACTEQNHFITQTDYLETVKADFEKVKKLSSNREKELFDVFNQKLSLEEKEALMFLYAYMPLNDLADYNGNFFLRNVQLALKTRETFEWGSQIPEDIFRHFVLPYRVNNENLDSSRAVFFNELKTRLRGLNLKEAILEVNHWCHEKVNYQPTDIRTISPLGAIKSTYGRCGEESTFTVTAMRAAGIPARQCYTPRWAHTDDNHAWVEVWVDGKWHYLGACEPEPDLDIAWFSAPAMRAMLVNSNVFGKYNGPEEIIRKEDKYTKVNMLNNYAPVKTLYVKVVDTDNQEVKDATVEFQLYNYAEFYPIAKKMSNNKGIASLMTGFGDLIVWAYKNNQYAYKKITVEQLDTITLKLQKSLNKEYSEIYDIIPPIAKIPKSCSDKGVSVNEMRLAQEDSIRNYYASSFMKKEDALVLAAKYNLDKSVVWDKIEKSKGNYSEIATFIKQGYKLNSDFTIPLLKAIAAKDLRDGESKILLSHLEHSFKYSKELPEINRDVFVKYVLNPRIENEKLISYKSFLQNSFGDDFIKNTQKDISHLVNWINTELTIDDKINYYKVPITAKGVYDLKISDSYSRDLFFVAACRSFGIPSRLEPATKIPQYYNSEWINVNFKIKKKNIAENTGTLELINDPTNKTDLKYRVHFAISKFEKGKYHTLDYGWETPFSKMDKNLKLEAGKYLLITGNRQSNGSILTQMQYFNIEENKNKKLEVSIRKNNTELKPIARITLPERLERVSGEKLLINNQSVNLFGILNSEKEPSKHTLVDIEKIASSFDMLNTNIYLFVKPDFNTSKYNLPKKTNFITNSNITLINSLLKNLNAGSSVMPVFFVVKNNNVYFLSKGYTIGIGEQIIKTIQKI